MTRFLYLFLLGGGLFGLFMGLFFAPCVFLIGWEKVVLLGVFSGLAFGLCMAGFAVSPAARVAPPELAVGERLLCKGGANHLVNNEGVGGWLFLTNERLLFVSHRFNVQPHSGWLALVDIQEARPFRVWQVFPTGLLLHLQNGNVERFIVEPWIRWPHRIRAARSAQAQPTPLLEQSP